MPELLSCCEMGDVRVCDKHRFSLTTHRGEASFDVGYEGLGSIAHGNFSRRFVPLLPVRTSSVVVVEATFPQRLHSGHA